MSDGDTPLRFLSGVGPAKAKALADAGLRTVWDVVHAVPRCLGSPPPLIDAGELPLATDVRVRARVLRVRPLFRRGARMSIEVAAERADGIALRARFWNAGYLRRHFVANEWYLFEGKTDASTANLLLHPSFQHLPSGALTELPADADCRVAYRIPEQFSERSFTALVALCLEQLPAIIDPAGRLTPQAYQQILLDLHRPSSPEAHERARRVLAEREFLAMAWLLQSRRAAITAQPGRAWTWNDRVHERALTRLPFILTAGQIAALAHVRADLRARAPMYRLLHGDVGSGKTALALICALAVIADSAQTMLLAPTTVLARQHYDFCARCLLASKVRLGILTGGAKPNERRKLLDAVRDHQIDLLIGTHALLDEEVVFDELGLVVIDEQHKFGVEQRALLLNRAAQAYHPDLLLMTATPIPRTLALTAFGDLAVTRIEGKPPGRGAIVTEVRRLRSFADLADTVRSTVAAGDQAYVICPLREESESVAAADVESVHAQLSELIDGSVGLLHGSLPETEKLAVLGDFVSGKIRVLVSTTVIEVGIDVPTATLMAVLDADRFGLSTLHQLRGRIGRGSRSSRCILFHRGVEAAERLHILSRNDDGLAIAEADLAERGPGQLLGTGQHGAFALLFGDLVKDLDLLQAAHQQVRERLAAGATCPVGLVRLQSSLGDAKLLSGG